MSILVSTLAYLCLSIVVCRIANLTDHGEVYRFDYQRNMAKSALSQPSKAESFSPAPLAASSQVKQEPQFSSPKPLDMTPARVVKTEPK